MERVEFKNKLQKVGRQLNWGKSLDHLSRECMCKSSFLQSTSLQVQLRAQTFGHELKRTSNYNQRAYKYN